MHTCMYSETRVRSYVIRVAEYLLSGICYNLWHPDLGFFHVFCETLAIKRANKYFSSLLT